MKNEITRRNVLKTFAATAAGAFAVRTASQLSAEEALADVVQRKGNIRQSVCRGCFRQIPLEELVVVCKKLGIVGLDLVDPDQWEIVQKGGLIVTLSRAPGASMGESFNHLQYHDKTIAVYEDLIPRAAKANVKNVICFSGNRKGISDEEGLENCIKGLKRIVPLAEKHGVTLQMELLNSIGHKDYHADHTAWGAAVARGVGSENFKLLYDIFHMQIMEGNLIDTIRKNKDVIGHYHTAGVPGRAEIDDTQEINYPPVMKAILATGFKGFVAHEFTPKREDKIASLRQAVDICDI